MDCLGDLIGLRRQRRVVRLGRDRSVAPRDHDTHGRAPAHGGEPVGAALTSLRFTNSPNRARSSRPNPEFLMPRGESRVQRLLGRHRPRVVSEIGRPPGHYRDRRQRCPERPGRLAVAGSIVLWLMMLTFRGNAVRGQTCRSGVRARRPLLRRSMTARQHHGWARQARHCRSSRSSLPCRARGEASLTGASPPGCRESPCSPDQRFSAADSNGGGSRLQRPQVSRRLGDGELPVVARPDPGRDHWSRFGPPFRMTGPGRSAPSGRSGAGRTCHGLAPT